MGDPTQTDLVVAVLGASVALGGFMLVFLALVVEAIRTHPGTTRNTSARHALAGWTTYGAFVLSVASVVLATIWLAIPGGSCLFWVCVAAFWLDLAVIVGVAGGVTRRLIK